MIDIKFEGLADVRKAMKGFESQIPYAMAVALTKTAEKVQQDLVVAMASKLDNPTPYTLRGTYKKPATKSRLYSEVGLKDFSPKGVPAAKYLEAQIKGGGRRAKASERNLRFKGLLKPGQFLYPGDDVRLNKYGNIPKAQVVRALSNVGGQNDVYQNTTRVSAARSVRQGSRQYFWMPGRGIFWRQGKGLRSFLAVGRKPTYRPSFDFFGVVEKSLRENLPAQAEAAVKHAIETAR